VFIRNGLGYALHQPVQPGSPVRIFEAGFGTGLNALLTYYYCLDRNIHAHYTALEPYPLEYRTVESLNYPDRIRRPDARRIFRAMHDAPSGVASSISSLFVLTRLRDTLEDVELPEHSAELLYFDAFGPDAQPECWTSCIFEKLFAHLVTGGILVTYSSKGAVRRTLRDCGFTVEKLPGPPGKRHVIRAIKEGQADLR
jgi:tRNA U34 5-methylaminomethyl-2-thiouridine-forming methyltransferase MnmC